MIAIPLLGDLPATKTRYEAGDRILAKVSTELTPGQFLKLRRNIIKFCQADVNLFVVNTARYAFYRAGADVTNNMILAERRPVTNESKLGLANIDLAKVEFEPGDSLLVQWPKDLPIADETKRALQRWVGDNVAVLFSLYP